MRGLRAEVQQLLLTTEEVQKLIHLRADRLPWKTIAEDFPGYSISILRNIHRLERACGILSNEKPNRKPKEPVPPQTEPPLTPQEFQKLVNMRAAKRSWISVAENFPGYSVPDLKKIHKSERARGVIPEIEGRQKRPACELQWFPPCEKRQRTQRELSAEYSAVVIGEEDSDPGRIVFI
jgi:hypothetical protein